MQSNYDNRDQDVTSKPNHHVYAIMNTDTIYYIEITFYYMHYMSFT